MFIHAVLFQIKSRHVKIYKNDCRMWARYARQAPGFLGYSTLKRVDAKNQYASVYQWKAKSCHKRFMDKWHEKLVAKSHCPVKVLGYYNFLAVQKG